MGHNFEHREIAYQVEIDEQKNGYTWWYQVKGRPIRENRDRPLKSENLALLEARHEATAEIDRLLAN